MSPADVGVLERNCWPLLSMKMIVADGSMCCDHASRSRMLEGKACVVGEDVAVCIPMAMRCGAEVPSDSSRSCNRGEVIGM